MVRLSNFEATLKLMRVGKLALMVPVMMSTEGRCVAMIRWMPGGPRHLRQPLHGRFDLLAGDQHQVGELVDHHDDVGQRRGSARRIAGWLPRSAPGAVRALKASILRTPSFDMRA